MKLSSFMLSLLLLFLVSAPLLPAGAEWAPSWTTPTEDRPALDVPYVPTPPEVVQAMLTAAHVNSRDILYDLGCGDGRIVVAAAKERKVKRAVGIDLDPERIRESNENARQAGVSERVTFHQKDLFDMDFREATVVSMYLLPSVNLKLRPRLLRELAPGTRIVSHDFDMGDWEADRIIAVGTHTVYFWVVPANMSGTWKWSLTDGNETHQYELRLRQKYQNVDKAELAVDGAEQEISSVAISGDTLEFTTEGAMNGRKHQLRFSGKIQNNSIRGSISASAKGPGRKQWTAEREDPSTKSLIDLPAEKMIQL